MTTSHVRILAGTPRVMKCFTCKYLCPVCESSIIIAAIYDLIIHRYTKYVYLRETMKAVAVTKRNIFTHPILTDNSVSVSLSSANAIGVVS